MDADSDPVPAYHFDADTDADPDYQNDADPDPDPQHCPLGTRTNNIFCVPYLWCRA